MVAIIAILAAIAVPNFLEAQVRAKVSRARADLRSMATAVETYRIDNNGYPTHGRVTVAGGVEYRATATTFFDRNEFAANTLTSPVAYVTTLPADPFAVAIPQPAREIRLYNYINLSFQAKLPGAPPTATMEGLLAQWGGWRMSACGPDQDRGYDTKTNVFYDATNGTISDGDIMRSQRVTQ